MVLFIITSILPIVLLIIAVFLSIKARMTAKDKDSKRDKTIALITALCSLLSLGIIHVPSPNIYPLDNEVRVYEGKAEVIIESDNSVPFLHTYYSLDGSDPKNGNIYNGSFTISKSTTVVAKNRFLHFWWSEPSRSTYRFENIPITSSNSVNPYIDDKFISLNEIRDLIKIFVGFIIVIYLFKITLIDGFKNLFRH